MSLEETADRLVWEVNRIGAIVARDRQYKGSDDELALLTTYEEICARLERRDDRATALWVRSFLLENRGLAGEAEDAILAIRNDRETARLGSRQLAFMASLTGAFPALAVRLATLRMNASAEDVFDAIEWAKGRSLEDWEGGGRWATLEDLRRALRGTHTHYITYLLDRKYTFAVLLVGDGTATSHRFDFGSDHVKAHAYQKYIRPGGAKNGASWTSVIAGITEPIEKAISSNRIKPGDTLLISPHELLHLFPLHQLPVCGTPLGENLAVVRVHAAAEVIRRIKAGPPAKPQSFITIRAPRLKEFNDPDHKGAFETIHAELGEHLPQLRPPIDGVQADAPALFSAIRPRTVLHVMAHGDVIQKGRPLDRSYIHLAADGKLPQESIETRHGPPGALTPAALFDAVSNGTLMLSGAHVTLQACVSGHASANPQGDAIGLEWAFLIGGAASALGTHWNVDFPDAIEFSRAFYRAWLSEPKMSRAAAWLVAGATLRRRHSDFRWAAYSLTGEWR